MFHQGGITIQILICKLEYVKKQKQKMNRVFLVCCSLLCFSVGAVNAHPGYKWCRLTGGVKVDVKAQSHSKLYNRAEESTWQSHWWDGEERERSAVWGKKKKRKKRRAFVCVYPPHCTYNMQHMSFRWIGKMRHWQLRWWFFLHPYYSSF